MIDPNLRLKVVQKGTHILPMREWNNDRPSPCECVAEALYDLEYRIGELIRSGGDKASETGAESIELQNVFNAARGLNSALVAATNQQWKLDLLAPVGPCTAGA